MKLHQRIRGEQGRHTDDWLMTYADMITLLLCLFVVILSIKTGGKVPPPAAAEPSGVRAAAETGFDQHAPFATLAPMATSDAEDAPSGSLRFVTDPPRAPAVEDTPSEPIDVAVPDPAASTHAAAVARLEAPVPVVVPPVREKPETGPALPPIVGRLSAAGSAVVEQQGDRITTVQINSGAFFSSGNAVLSGAGKSILRDVAVTLKSADLAAYHISIEGHTDDMPISTPQFQSNWELSTARAAAVVRFFLEQGVPAAKLSASGYADTFPIAPNRNADGTVIPDNQARNRRVVIKLEKIDRTGG